MCRVEHIGLMGQAMGLLSKSRLLCRSCDILFPHKSVKSKQSHLPAPHIGWGNQSLRLWEEIPVQGAEMRNNHFMSESLPRPRNLILAQLPDAEYESLAKFLVPVDLPLEMRLSEPNEPIEYIYFLNTRIDLHGCAD